VPLTVKDILEKTFKRSFKGYDEDEVDKFLDQIIDEFKELQNENALMKNELTVLREQARKVKDAEETIMNTLVSAQKSAERVVGDASRKAELIISSAESTARSRSEQTTKELADAETKLEELKACAQGFATSFANMINTQAAHFEKTYRSYFGQEDTPFGGGINTEALERIDKDIARSLKDMPGLHVPEEVPPMPEASASTESEELAQTLATESADDTEAAGEAGFMELFEINKMLGELESGDYPAAPVEAEKQEEAPEAEPKVVPKSMGEYKPKYDDYSWIYENEDKPDDLSVSFKDPQEKEDLKTLIDEIID
jgi:cell division initiation protein